MSHRSFLLLVAVLFAVIALLHALRLWLRWEAVIGGWAVPPWASWIALVLGVFLAWQGFRLARR